MVSDNQIVVLAGVAMQTMDANKLTLATAVALAESGGSETETNRNDDGSIDVGIWQINSVHRERHPEWTTAWLKVPSNNASAMAVVSGNGSNWQPWTAYKNGRYEIFMRRAQAAVAATPTADVTDVVNQAVDSVLPGDPLQAISAALTSTVEVLNTAAKWIGDPRNWIRVVQVNGGVILGIVAIAIVIRPVVESTAARTGKAIVTKGLG